MTGNPSPRELDDTSAPDVYRIPADSAALVAYLTTRLSVEQRTNADLRRSLDEVRSLTSPGSITAVRSALTVATWWLDRGPRRWPRAAAAADRARPYLVRLRLARPSSGRLISPRDLEAALTELDLFDADDYVARVPEARGAPLRHYLDHGYDAGLAPGPGFDPAVYLSVHPDVANAGVDALGHYLTVGWREGRSGVGPITRR